jgi:NAD(P)-dependent dehydrogenase (short-subunit alcohol dehydrogenase family)
VSANSPATRTLVITGASKGIGLATARHFQEAGYRVVNISRTPTPLAGAVQISADLAAAGWCAAVAPALLDAVAGSASVALVHNSALQMPGGVSALEETHLRAMLEVNVVAPALLNCLLLPHMPRGSCVLYLGSTLSLRATPQMAAYVTCKHALLGLMRSTCQDLAGTGIHTALVCPGFTDTEMLRSYGGEALERLAALSTQGRLIDPGEIAEVIYFGATHAVVNGAILGADSGLIEH